MPKVSTKKAAKKAAKKTGAVRGAGGRFAGRPAPKLSKQAEELLETSGPFAEADPPVEEAKPVEEAQPGSGNTDEAAEPRFAFNLDDLLRKSFTRAMPRQELLHRRVEVKIFDSNGKQMQSSSFDLVAKDMLSLAVAESSIVGSISNIEGR